MKKFMYYLIQWTWGLPLNLIGAIVCLVCLCCKCQINKYRNGVEIIVPQNFGGVEFGMFFVRGKDCAGVAPHEYGHGIQNLWWGPLFPFVITIPSATRYWIRQFKTPKARRTFVCLFIFIITILCSILTVIGFTFGLLPLIIISTLFFAYGIVIWSWLRFKEIPDFEDKKTKYDDVWFEGQATKLGNDANSGRWTWL